MKHIFLNLKRFDISPEKGGVNRLAPMKDWGRTIVSGTQDALTAYDPAEVEFVMYMPEAHLLGAAAAKTENSPVQLGCQGVYRADTAVGGNFGAFTTNRPANAAAQMGCASTLIGHCEERMNLRAIMGEAGAAPDAVEAAVNRVLAREVAAAQAAGLTVLFCMGEREEEVDSWEEVLTAQLTGGLEGADLSRVRVAYEPVSIGPGKTPADAPYIQKVARLIKATLPGVDVVYGGGLKADNAQMLAGIPEIDGGLIALTRFTGEIGFYPEEYAEIVKLYLEA